MVGGNGRTPVGRGDIPDAVVAPGLPVADVTATYGGNWGVVARSP